MFELILIFDREGNNIILFLCDYVNMFFVFVVITEKLT